MEGNGLTTHTIKVVLPKCFKPIKRADGTGDLPAWVVKSESADDWIVSDGNMNFMISKEDSFMREQEIQANSDQEQKANIQMPTPSEEVFHYRKSAGSMEKSVMVEGQHVYLLDRIEYPDEGGIFIYKKGRNGVHLKYPTKGFPTPEAVGANNAVKRYLMSQVRFFARTKIFILAFLSKKILNLWLREFVDFSRTVMIPYLLEENRYCTPCKEIRIFVREFLLGIGLEEDIAKEAAWMFANIIEYEDAYRLRMEDIALETTGELLLKNPRKEFKKLIKVLQERDPRVHLPKKFEAFFSILSYGLYIPKIHRAFNRAIKVIDFTKIQMDEADKYHCLSKAGYNFFGRDIKDRVEEFTAIHEGNPPLAYFIHG